MNPEIALEQLMVKAARINAATARVRGRGAAAAGRVRVEVDATGSITQLSMAEDLRQVAFHDLARLITDAQRLAVAQAQAAVAQLQAELTDDPYVGRLANAAVATPTAEPESAQPETYQPLDEDYSAPKSWRAKKW